MHKNNLLRGSRGVWIVRRFVCLNENLAHMPIHHEEQIHGPCALVNANQTHCSQHADQTTQKQCETNLELTGSSGPTRHTSTNSGASTGRCLRSISCPSSTTSTCRWQLKAWARNKCPKHNHTHTCAVLLAQNEPQRCLYVLHRTQLLLHSDAKNKCTVQESVYFGLLFSSHVLPTQRRHSAGALLTTENVDRAQTRAVKHPLFDFTRHSTQ